MGSVAVRCVVGHRGGHVEPGRREQTRVVDAAAEEDVEGGRHGGILGGTAGRRNGGRPAGGYRCRPVIPRERKRPRDLLSGPR